MKIVYDVKYTEVNRYIPILQKKSFNRHQKWVTNAGNDLANCYKVFAFV